MSKSATTPPRHDKRLSLSRSLFLSRIKSASSVHLLLLLRTRDYVTSWVPWQTRETTFCRFFFSKMFETGSRTSVVVQDVYVNKAVLYSSNPWLTSNIYLSSHYSLILCFNSNPSSETPLYSRMEMCGLQAANGPCCSVNKSTRDIQYLCSSLSSCRTGDLFEFKISACHVILHLNLTSNIISDMFHSISSVVYMKSERKCQSRFRRFFYTNNIQTTHRQHTDNTQTTYRQHTDTIQRHSKTFVKHLLYN